MVIGGLLLKSRSYSAGLEHVSMKGGQSCRSALVQLESGSWCLSVVKLLYEGLGSGHEDLGEEIGDLLSSGCS